MLRREHRMPGSRRHLGRHYSTRQMELGHPWWKAIRAIVKEGRA